MSRHWILDGHNIIFAVGELQRLQTSGRGTEARALLVERLEAFAHRRQERVLLVFDGRGVHGPQASRRAALFEEIYSRGEGGADLRILDEARRLAAQGTVVTVVTNDMRTLANALPREARRLRVRDFWLEHIEPPAGEDEKRIEGDFSDIEQSLLALPPDQRPRPVRPGAASGSGERNAAPRSGHPAAVTREEAVRRKRERGRLRQARLLERRKKGD